MRNVLAFLVLWVALIVESTVFQIPPIWVVRPNLVLVVLVIAAMTRGPRAALVLGVLVGLIQDIEFGSFIGLAAFTYGIVGYFAAASFAQFLHRNVSIAFIVTVVLTFVQVWITFGMTRLFDVTAVSWQSVMSGSFPQMIQNGVALLVLYAPLRKLFANKPSNRYEIKSSDSL